MAILIDPPAWPAHSTLWSHLVSDSDYDELHVFARRLGVPRRGFDLDHYDVPASLYKRAIELGAHPVTAKDIVHQLRDSGLRVRQVEREAIVPVRRRQYLRSEWAGLGNALGVGLGGTRQFSQSKHTGRAGQSTEDWLILGESLIGRWNEPHRVYHDERHLEDVLLALNHLGVRGERVEVETLLAAWFHDAIYAGESDDELNSARLAVSSLKQFSLSSGLVQLVGDFIVRTTPARLVEDPPPALAHLLDADLSIFASSMSRYEQYTSAVRSEYAHVADADFANGRAHILRSYVSQPFIYRTEAARKLWEDRARANLTLEIERLQGG